MQTTPVVHLPFSASPSPIFVTARPNATPVLPKRTVRVSKSPKMTPRLIKSSQKVRAESHLTQQNTFQLRKAEQQEKENRLLQDEYVQINREIALLECELIPLRERCEQLKLTIMSFHSVYRNDEIYFDPPNFTSAYIEIQNERDDLTEQLNEAINYYSSSSIKEIQEEIDQGINFCELLTFTNGELKKQTDEIYSKIDRLKCSQLYRDVQDQKKKIVELDRSYEDAKLKHAALKAEYYQLTDPVLNKNDKDSNAAGSVMKLIRKLNAVKRHHYDTIDKLMQLKDDQLKEVEEITAAMHHVETVDSDYSESVKPEVSQPKTHKKVTVLTKESLESLERRIENLPSFPLHKGDDKPIEEEIKKEDLSRFETPKKTDSSIS